MDQNRGNTSMWSVLLRPAFGLALFASQFTAGRDSYFSESWALLAAGALVTVLGVGLLVWASRALQRAREVGGIATDGPFRWVRHPITLGIYVFSIGLGLLFFAWLWFGVLLLFLPLWVLDCRAEERALIARFGGAYEAYRDRTGMLLPRVF